MLKFQKYWKEELSNSGGPREAQVVTPVTIIFNHEFFNYIA